ncbi:MAG: NAD(P)/FAD-dependent oxidoreductase [Phycisphaerales bacterium]|nr:NAD(P)/FAD-dependent oxidoreductase [Phycisphaerales bacterium]
MKPDHVDIAIIGAGAAGLMAAIHAGRTAQEAGASLRIVALDGAQKIGAKILVSGGGRCNVTHHTVDADEYAGSSRAAIAKVLRRFTVADTIAFFRALGVELKREDTGKLFPTTDSARTVLDALLRAVHDAAVDLRHPWRVSSIERTHSGFVINGAGSEMTRASRVILCTGGQSLPKSGSDGVGYAIARALGHTITPRLIPALVPITLEAAHTFIPSLPGLSTRAKLEVRSSTGKRIKSFTNDTLCTHFGLSGPAPMDISRYLTAARVDDPDAALVINWLPDETFESIDRALLDLAKRTILSFLRERLPERLARALCDHADVDPATPGAQLSREHRKALAHAITNLQLPVTGDRGWNHAEVTAGGVPLAELDLASMESRVCPGLHLAGEVCDVDGRIGGFNFQWAWASGFVAGTAAASAACAQQVD